MLTQTAGKVEIRFSLEQRQQIYLATGLDHTTTIELGSTNLAALVLAAMAAGKDALPISGSSKTIKQMLGSAGPSETKPFILTIPLTADQQNEIQRVTGRSVGAIMLAPDEINVICREEWEDGPPLLRVGRSIVLVSDSETYEPSASETAIILPRSKENQQTVFGTGIHPATQLALVLLEEHLKENSRVLDLGTGSGVLAIAAAKLGARAVTAIDIEPAAVDMAQQMCAANGVNEVVNVKLGSIEAADGTFDFTVVNIFTGVIIALASELAKVVEPAGLILVSGIIAARTDDVVTALGEVGFIEQERRTQNGWCAVLLRLQA
jgi:ribosomal protein L11 methylase PrmA